MIFNRKPLTEAQKKIRMEKRRFFSIAVVVAISLLASIVSLTDAFRDETHFRNINIVFSATEILLLLSFLFIWINSIRIKPKILEIIIFAAPFILVAIQSVIIKDGYSDIIISILLILYFIYYSQDPLKRGIGIVANLFFIPLAIISGLTLDAIITGQPLFESQKYFEKAMGFTCPDNYNVAKINLSGDMYVNSGYKNDISADWATRMINDAEKSPEIKLVLVTMNSYGGELPAGESISNKIKETRTKKPVFAQITSAANSSAYWAISSANKIFASETSDIGGIGVVLSYLDYSKQNEDTGINYNVISSGVYKDTGNPNRKMTDDEKAFLNKKILSLFDIFVNSVSENRGISIEKVKEIADGRSFISSEAKALGLIDDIKNEKQVVDEIEKQINKKPIFCEVYFAP